MFDRHFHFLIDEPMTRRYGYAGSAVFDLPKTFVPPRTVGFDLNGRVVEIDAVQERSDLFPDFFVREPTASEIVDFSVTRVRQDQP